MIGVNLTHRLGNQLFILATAYSLAKDNKTKVACPDFQYKNAFIYHFQNQEFNPLFVYKEPHFHYKPISYIPGITLSGYFQSEKYFVHNKDFIKELFELKEEFPKTQECAIHVRRGDYLKYPNHHPTLPISYYEQAIDLIKRHNPKIKFLVFSDDREWCKKNFRLSVFEGKDEIEDFSRMKACSYHIIANSTYSWWAAWLGSEKVIAPKQWFGPAYSHYNLQDLLPESWIKI